MSRQPPVESEASPAGEHIHMPAPSLIPLLNAIGLAGSIVSITLSPYLLVAALTLFLVTTVVWIRDTIRDTGELPLEHH